MSVLDVFHAKGIHHAVCRNEEWAIDYFALCHKKQLRMVHLMIEETIPVLAEEVYIIKLTGVDIQEFYNRMRLGQYVQKIRTPTGTVWEQPGIGFRRYMMRFPSTKKK
jgi:hypothetical protein